MFCLSNSFAVTDSIATVDWAEVAELRDRIGTCTFVYCCEVLT